MAAHGEDAIFQAGCTMPECGSASHSKATMLARLSFRWHGSNADTSIAQNY